MSNSERDRLDGRRALVTGGTKGSGRAVADRLRELGADVYVSARSMPSGYEFPDRFIAADEQGLASGMVQTSFQFGGALVLAIVTAVNSAAVDGSQAPGAVLDGFQTALIVPVIVAAVGLAITLLGVRTARPIPTPATA